MTDRDNVPPTHRAPGWVLPAVILLVNLFIWFVL
jgi:hypothetical protein